MSVQQGYLNSGFTEVYHAFNLSFQQFQRFYTRYEIKLNFEII